MPYNNSSFMQGLRTAIMMGRSPRIPYLQSQEIKTISLPSSISIATQRLKPVRKASKVYIAYTENGNGHVIHSYAHKNIGYYEWIEDDFGERADDIDIVFNGRSILNGPFGREFITEVNPWVFWVDMGSCKGKILNYLGSTVVLASGHCSKVSAICDIGKSNVTDSFGLVVFMLLDNQIFYRQYIDNEWKDAEFLNLGPEGNIWKDISAFRTWDYRIGLQAITYNGDVYEFFSQYKGMSGKLITEHVELSAINISELNLIGITYPETKNDEHIELSNIEPIINVYETGAPSIISAYNIEDSNHNYGKKIVVVFNKAIDDSELFNQLSTLSLVDSRDLTFPISSGSTTDKKTFIFNLLDFNNALGQCVIQYTPGTVHTMAGYSMDSMSYSFTPIGLVPEHDIPEIYSIINVGIEDI